MTPLVALVWTLTIDSGPSDSKPIIQVLQDVTAPVAGTNGECRVSAVFPNGERRLACQMGEGFVGIVMQCVPGDKKDAQLVLVQNDSTFRVKMVCSTPEGTKH